MHEGVAGLAGEDMFSQCGADSHANTYTHKYMYSFRIIRLYDLGRNTDFYRKYTWFTIVDIVLTMNGLQQYVHI